jgi:hypothetical protein
VAAPPPKIDNRDSCFIRINVTSDCFWSVKHNFTGLIDSSNSCFASTIYTDEAPDLSNDSSNSKKVEIGQ